MVQPRTVENDVGSMVAKYPPQIPLFTDVSKIIKDFGAGEGSTDLPLERPEGILPPVDDDDTPRTIREDLPTEFRPNQPGPTSDQYDLSGQKTPDGQQVKLQGFSSQ